VQKAANFLLDSTQYTVPSGATELAKYDRTKSPVTCLSGCTTINGAIILSATSAQASNYPVAAMQTAFNTAAHGTMVAGTTNITYNAYATLLTMQVFDSYGGTQSVIQTWRITGTGGLTGSRNATVEVVAMIETPKVPASSYAAFATDSTCGALTFGGNVQTDSYDSTNLSGATAPTLQGDGGDVGTNGNLSLNGHAEVQGNLYTPRTGIGTCEEGAVTALSETGHADVAGSVVQLPTSVTYPAPTVPTQTGGALLPAVSLTSGGTTVTTCALLGLTPVTNCNVSGNTITINGAGSTVKLPSLSLSAHVNIVLVASSPAAEYDFNSITLDGGSTIGASATSSTQGVLVNVIGKDNTGADLAMAIDFQGGTYTAVTGCATCSAYDASILQFVYGGSGEIKMAGNSNAAATFYAPNSSTTFVGTANLYGSILAKRLNETGSGNIYYDQRLAHDFYIAGHPMVGSFTWTRY
jgi:hypothetical protein